MKLSSLQISRIAAEVSKSISNNPSITVTGDAEKIKSSVAQVLKANLEDEKKLDDAVNAMMDTLEQQNPGGFQRYKMFPLLKKKLAEQRGFVL